MKQVGQQEKCGRTKQFKAERGHTAEMREACRRVYACVPLATGRAAK